MKKIKVGVLGATGMVGQRFITLLAAHPWFDIVSLVASPSSAGKTYEEAVSGKWRIDQAIPESVKTINVQAVEDDLATIANTVELVFSALDMDKEKIKEIEIAYAAKDVVVVSNNSAHRWTADVPVIMPEVNPDHIVLIDSQRKKRGWKKGCIVVKPNCSIQSYVTILTALKTFQPQQVHVTSLQAISGAGKTFEMWPEMIDNIIPLIGGEEEKSEQEPLKIWGSLKKDHIVNAETPVISATCIRVPVTNGHMASVSVRFAKKASKEGLLNNIYMFQNPLSLLGLPSYPHELIHYFEDEDRPQTKLDRDFEHGMGISMGRLRPDELFDWKFVALSHNTLRGAAGGAVLVAELLKAKGYI